MDPETKHRPRRLTLLVALAVGLVCAGVGPVRAEPPARAREMLGRRLFFDPILSADDRRSCASCHRPARGLTDGRETALGRHGEPQRRNTLTLYNVTVHERFFWDARVDRLEDAVRVPLLAPDELGADPDALVGELRAVDEYRRRFGRAFPEDSHPITVKNTSKALAAFLRSLTSFDAPFDRYKNGQEDALSPAQKRGLRLFRSLRTRCFECHVPPTFTLSTPRGIGVPGPDGGVGERTGEPAREGQFRVPTLRNVALTGPYMHDGSLETLREVVEFYADGGGRAHGVDPRKVASEVRGFSTTDTEVRDLVAFMHALTDTSVRPERPDTVPSGLEPAGGPD